MTDSPTLLLGDCFEVLQTLEAESVDACVCDPPYGLNFMGRHWDRGVPATDVWEQVYRVLKPGAHLLSFFGTRTYHRGVCAIEDAGFEIRDQIGWLYGCLSDDTEILINGKWEPHHKATAGSLALCYDVEHDEYSWQPIQERVVYDYADTAYRIQSDRTDQIVSRNHRCLVERFGELTFQLAEEIAWEREARVPVLEDLPDLLRAVPVPDQGAGDSEQDVQQAMHGQSDRREASQAAADVEAQGDEVDRVRGLREESLQAQSVVEARQNADVLMRLQRCASWQGLGEARTQGAGGMDGCEHGVLFNEDDRSQQPSMEGRGDVLPQARQLQADQIRPMPPGVFSDGTQGRLRDGASAFGGASDGVPVAEDGNGASREPRPAGQHAEQPEAVCEQPRSQALRASRFTRTDLARVTPFVYEGTVWCVRVPTGAFVARRNGKVFVTGNSGFPKSLDVSKAIDKAAGAKRDVLGVGGAQCEFIERGEPCPGHGDKNGRYGETVHAAATAPATEAAQQWDGWGTALKPSHEDLVWATKPLAPIDTEPDNGLRRESIVVARKPFPGRTVAQNVLEHGTGGLNIDATRVGTIGGTAKGSAPTGPGHGIYGAGLHGRCEIKQLDAGRFPANIIHDGSDEVLAEFAKYGERSSGSGAPRKARPGKQPFNTERGWNSHSMTRDGANAPEDYGDTGTAARFFYAAKSSKDDRWALLTCDCETVKPETWVSEDRSQGYQADGMSHQRDTTEGIETEGYSSSMFTDGSESTDLFPRDTVSTTGTATRSTTGSETSNSALTQNTSESMPDANSETEFGGNRAADADNSSPSTNPSGTSQKKGGPSTGVAASATYARSLRTKNCGVCGAAKVESHPTQKPTSLMRYLVRLVTPKGGLVLDPFAGSGTTLIAAYREDCRAIGIELDPDYFKMASHRIDNATAQLRLDI